MSGVITVNTRRAVAGIEGRLLQHVQAHHLQDLLHRLGQLQGARRRPHAVAGAHEQRVAQLAAHLGQRRAHRRLAQVQGLPGAGHALVLQHRVEHHEHVQVQVGDIQNLDS
jgi:hypothetical protein